MDKILKNCKTSEDVFRAVCKYFNEHNINNKYSTALKINLKRQTDFNKSIQATWNYILNQDFPTKSNDMKIIRHKGTSIQGMEVHSYGHS